VAALVLTAARTGEFVTDAEAKQLKAFDDLHSTWLAEYLAGPTCDAECKSRALSVMVAHFNAGQGSFDKPALQILEGPRAQSSMAVTFLHTRLLWCQIDPSDLAPLRDRVLVPAAQAVLTNPKAEPAVRDGLLSLVLLVDPPPADDEAAMDGWKELLAQIHKAGEPITKAFDDRRDVAEKQRKNPPPALKKTNFCAVQAVTSTLQDLTQ
jgi:hypothetical protein